MTDPGDDRTPAPSGPAQPGPGRRVAVTVTVSGVRLDDAVENLRAAGLVVEDVLPMLGVVTGTALQDRLAAVEAVPGVVDVERQRTFQVPPPDSDVQ